jgi:hypothetical protein
MSDGFGFEYTGLTTRDGHPIDLHWWDGKVNGVYVKPLPNDMAMPGEPRCEWVPKDGADFFREKGGCGLKPDHTCGHATEVRVEYRSLYSEAEGSEKS